MRGEMLDLEDDLEPYTPNAPTIDTPHGFWVCPQCGEGVEGDEGEEAPLMTDPLTQRVARGAALLDRERPGWHREIDMHDLQMLWCRKCIVGQLYGHYFDGMEQLDLDLGFDHGFAVYQPGEEELLLADTWCAEIRQRQQAEATEDAI